MFDEMRLLAGDAVLDRVVLLANHVVGAEPAALERMRPHAGRRVALHFAGWPKGLPPLPEPVFAVTPAGLFERTAAGAAADLTLAVDASNPALAALRTLAGERPGLSISGDAAFAADMQWLADHLRWDVQDDLERLVGPGAAHEIARLGAGIAAALREAAHTLAAFVGRGDGHDGAPPR